MSGTGATCAMCGDRLAEPYGGYDLPPVCVQLMDGGDDVDTSTIAGPVSVDLCRECTTIARRMVREYDTSPLPEFDVDAVSWQDAGAMAALMREDSDAVGGDDVDRRTIEDAAAVVQLHQAGDAGHVLESKVDRGYIILMALDELGAVEHDLLDE